MLSQSQGSNLACDWLSIVWAYSEHETENGSMSLVRWNLDLAPFAPVQINLFLWNLGYSIIVFNISWRWMLFSILCCCTTGGYSKCDCIVQSISVSCGSLHCLILWCPFLWSATLGEHVVNLWCQFLWSAVLCLHVCISVISSLISVYRILSYLNVLPLSLKWCIRYHVPLDSCYKSIRLYLSIDV